MRPFSLIGNSLPFSLQQSETPVMNTHEPVHMFDSFSTTARMRKIFSNRERLQTMLDFEGALARAESRAGIVPSGAAEAICAKCHADLVDLPALAHATPASGNLAI